MQRWENVLGDDADKVGEALGFEVLPSESLLREYCSSELLLRISHITLWPATMAFDPSTNQRAKHVPRGVPGRSQIW